MRHAFTAFAVTSWLVAAQLTSCSKPDSAEKQVYRAIDDTEVLRIRSADEVELTREGANFVCKYSKEQDSLRVVSTIMGTTQAEYFRFVPQGLRSPKGTILYSPAHYQGVMAKVNAERDQQKRNQALNAAAQRGDAARVRALLDEGAAIETPDQRGYTPLLNAIIGGHAAVVEILLERGANPNVANQDGDTALMFACNGGGHGYSSNVAPTYDRIAKLLIQHKAQVDRQQKNGQTALMYSVSRGNVDLVRELVAAGASRNVRDRTGKTVFDLTQDKAVRAALRTQEENEELKSFLKLPADGTALEITARPNVYSKPVNVDGEGFNWTYYGAVKVRLNRSREFLCEGNWTYRLDGGGNKQEAVTSLPDATTLEFMSAQSGNARVTVERR